jgi:tetratricopeptide (TPR) repeat protein
MNKLLSILIFLLAAQLLKPAAAKPADVLFEEGVKQYTDGNYQEAANTWNTIDETYKATSAELFYNLGNAYFKLTDYPSAILFYERAIKQNPSYDDAIYNLNVANMRITDKIEPLPELFYQVWFRKIVNLLNSNQWAWVFLFILYFGLILFAIYILSARLKLRKLGFYAGFLLFILATFAFYFGSVRYKENVKEQNAIIFIARSPVKSSPSEMGTDLFFIHAGTKVKIIDQIGNWVKIKIPDGNQGWIESDHFEVI